MALPDFLLVDKPVGPTSFDVVRAAKRQFSEKRIGHLGTLDPLASGLLVLALGPMTRILPALQGLPKTYRALAVLGATSTTDDREGTITETGGVIPARRTVGETLERFRGVIQQIPPAHSAAKIAGERAYDLARRGEDVVLAPRTVMIHELTVLRLDPPELEFDVTVSTGTYIRSLARDIGDALGCGAYLAQLRRMKIGAIHVEDAAPLDRMGDGARSAQDVLAGVLPTHALTDVEVTEFRNGRAWPAPAGGSGDVLLTWHDRAVGIAMIDQGWMRPKVVLLDRLS